MAEWQDKNPDAMNAISLASIFISPRSMTGLSGIEKKAATIESKAAGIESKAAIIETKSAQISKVVTQAEIRARVLKNINQSRIARESSNYKEFAKFEKTFKGVGDVVNYSRPSGFRKGVRDQVWENSKGLDGEVRDSLSKDIMNKNEPWDMGHKEGYEFRKHQQSAEARAISRKQFLNEHNNSIHYRAELPSSNRSHMGEDMTDQYFGD